MSAIKMSELEGYQRIDAEYYQPGYFRLLQSLDAAKAQPLKQFAKSVKRKFTPTMGQSFNYIEISEVDLTTGRINAVEMAGEEAPSRAQFVVKAGDVIISAVRPARNAVALISEKQSGFVCSSGFIILRPNKIPPEFLFASLKARHVSTLLDRRTTATMYPAVSEADVLDTPILIPSPEVISRIAERVTKATNKEEESILLYAHAQALLAAELGLDKLDLPTEGISTRWLSAVVTASRIDAEYYHSQKAYVQDWLDKLPGKAISTYFKSVREIYNPPQADTGKSILNFDLTDALRYFVDETGPMIPENEIGSIKKRLRNGDVIVSRLRSYLKEIALVEVPKGVECVGSSEFIVLRPLSIEVYPEALAVYLRSDPVQTILKWSQDGSNHPRFQEDELLAIKLPDRVIKVQGEIRKLIRSGIQAYRTANDLLAEAKAEVERLIEQV